jgi:hypothetical protein
MRLVGLRDHLESHDSVPIQLVDGIYAEGAVCEQLNNPLKAEFIPLDQMEMGETDRLVPIAFLKRDLEPATNSAFGRVVPMEPFFETKPRIFELGQIEQKYWKTTNVFVVTNGSGSVAEFPLLDNSILWDLINDTAYVKVILPFRNRSA